MLIYLHGFQGLTIFEVKSSQIQQHQVSYFCHVVNIIFELQTELIILKVEIDIVNKLNGKPCQC